MKPSIKRITTPNAGQFIELRSHQEMTFTNRGGLQGYFGFYEFRLVRDGRTTRWLVDALVPPEYLQPGFGWQDSGVIGFRTEGPTQLDDKGILEFKVHVSSPIAPRTKGVWLRIDVRFDTHDGLVFDKHTTAWLFDGAQWAEPSAGIPDWLRGGNQSWELETGRNANGIRWRSLSQGNTLLNASWQDPGALCGNLLHFEEGLKGKADDDYRFALVPIEREKAVFDVCTTLVVAKDFGSPAPVSYYALLLSQGRRAMAALGARGVHLICEPEQDANDNPSGWTIRWLEIPGQPDTLPRHTFTLESFSEAHFSAHGFGLATTRSRNRLSLVPTWVSTVANTGTCKMTFRAVRKDFNVSDVRLRRVELGTPTDLRLTCAGAQGTDGSSWDLVVRASDRHLDASEAGLLAHWDLASIKSHSNAHQIGAGSVLLTIDDFRGGELALSCHDHGDAYRRLPLESELRLEFDSVRYGPLSMDPEIGFETLSAVVGRPRPWTFDLAPGNACPATFWEKASNEQSRLLRIEVRAPTEAEIKTDVVMVDPSPFTVVRVRTTEQAVGDGIVAEYTDDADQAPEWRFYSEFGDMTAILPPQGIGEEMVKGYLFLDDNGHKTSVPLKDKLFDFRLTPVARLQLDRTDIDTARSEAPWSLRRLLGQRTGTTGVKLERARFELLYGLQTQLEAPGLRIAELDGLVGRIPYSDALRRKLIQHKRGIKGLEQNYASDVSQWQAGLWHRPSWWRVYSDVAKRKTLVVQDGVQYTLRPTRLTADPFDIGQYANKEKGQPADAPWKRKPLRGGVDWPFQSSNVYDELLRAPSSTSGAVEGLAFGSLGGEGAQTAAFNNGKTLIISSSRQGRLDSLTLIRVGRIAMTWNKARHVIVYERTTRRAPRYDLEDGKPLPTDDDLELQPPLDGMAALRKVREYVEITEPRRRYPDSTTDRPVSGPLVQSVFGTTVVPVMSSWGRDIPSGFVIALRGPIPKDKERFFPDPQVFLDFARPTDKGGGAVSQRVTSTERLVFFSSARDQDGGDTDVWPAWPDVDFPLIRPGVVTGLPFRSSFTGLRQPDAPAADLAMTPFTLVLAPAEEAVNLMHGRNVAGIEAKLSNINLARGLPEAPKLNDAAQLAQNKARDFGDQRAQLLEGLGDLRAAIRHYAVIDRTAPLDGQLRKDFDSLLRSLKAPSGLAEVPPLDLKSVQSNRSDAFKQGIADEAKRLDQQLTDYATRAGQGAPKDLEALKRGGTALVDAVNAQAKERLGNLSVARVEALDQGRTFIEGLTNRLVSQLSTAASQVGQAQDILRSQLAAQPEKVSNYEAEWRERMSRLPAGLRGFLEALVPAMNGALGQWFSRLGNGDTLHDRVQAPVEAALGGLADYIERWIAALPPFEIQMPDLGAIDKALKELLSPDIASQLLSSITAEFRDLLSQLGGWDQVLQDTRRELDDKVRKLQSELLAAVDPTKLAESLTSYAKSLQADLENGAMRVVTSLQVPDAVETAMAALQGSFDALATGSKEITDAVAAIQAQAQGTVGELEKAVQENVGIAEAYIAAGSRQVENWARDQIAPAFEIGKRNVDAALETVRVLAEGPVAQGLQATRDQVGYYFDKASDALAITPTTAILNDLGRNTLNALSANIPFDGIRERLLPAIRGLAVRDLFPDFCGIKLTDLLPDLDVSSLDGTEQYDWLTVQHGFNDQRISAWAKVLIDKRFDTDATLFDLGPIKLRLLKPLFHAVIDVVYEDGRQRQLTSGRLESDFELSLNGKPMVTLVDGVLAFDERGKLDFLFDSDKLELAEELNFIQQALQALMPQVDGLTLTPLLPAGVEALLCLPLPDIGTGAFTLTGVTLNSNLGLRVGNGFEIRTGLWLSKPERPFGLAVLFLGGGGWFGIEATYKPPSTFVTRVSIGVSAGAFIALNFGFASGSAGLLFTAGVDFYRDWQTGSGTTAVSVGLLVWGEFSILGIASAGVRLMLRITYEDGGMRGEGTLSVSIKICWCYTLRVNRGVQKQFSGSSSKKSGAATAQALVAEAVEIGVTAIGTPQGSRSRVDTDISMGNVARDYRSLDKPSPIDAVERYFDTLAI